jgi:hypothetical protein
VAGFRPDRSEVRTIPGHAINPGGVLPGVLPDRREIWIVSMISYGRDGEASEDDIRFESQS